MKRYENEVIYNEKRLYGVFVYGTLMKGFWNYRRYLEGKISYVASGKTQGLLYHLPERYPALITGNKLVEGEIIEPIDENLLKTLDRLEGYSEQRSKNLYTREVRNVWTKDGNEVPCWVYVYSDVRYAQENGILVLSGNWRKFMENRRSLNE